jgi:DNA-binding response OmpR family regulator
MFTAKGPPPESVTRLGLGPDVYVSKSAQAKVLLEQIATLLRRNA